MNYSSSTDRLESLNTKPLDAPSPLSGMVSQLYADMSDVFKETPTAQNTSAISNDGSIDFGLAASPYSESQNNFSTIDFSSARNAIDWNPTDTSSKAIRIYDRNNSECSDDFDGDQDSRTAGALPPPADTATAVTDLTNQMGAYNATLANAFTDSADGGAAALTTAANLESAMFSDPNLANNAGLDSSLLAMDQNLAQTLGTYANGEQIMDMLMQGQETALGILNNSPVDVPSPPTSSPAPTPIPIDTPPPPATTPAPIDTPPPPAPKPDPNPGTTGTDLTSIFQAGDSGVTSEAMQHAEAIANALPEDMKAALKAAGVQLTMQSGYQPGDSQGMNNGQSGSVYIDSGMSDQAEVHELYEMYGQTTPNGAGSWSDPKAVSLSDSGMAAAGPSVQNEGDLNDTVGNTQGDGDHLSNAFTADFFATHPELLQDSIGQNTISQVAQDDPTLTAYIAKAQDLATA